MCPLNLVLQITIFLDYNLLITINVTCTDVVHTLYTYWTLHTCIMHTCTHTCFYTVVSPSPPAMPPLEL